MCVFFCRGLLLCLFPVFLSIIGIFDVDKPYLGFVRKKVIEEEKNERNDKRKNDDRC